MSEILALARLKQDLIKSKVCENAPKLTSRDLCLTFCEILMWDPQALEHRRCCGGAHGRLGCWRAPGLLGQWADVIGPVRLEFTKPIPEEDCRSELCEKHTESAAVDQVFLPRAVNFLASDQCDESLRASSFQLHFKPMLDALVLRTWKTSVKMAGYGSRTGVQFQMFHLRFSKEILGAMPYRDVFFQWFSFVQSPIKVQNPQPKQNPDQNNQEISSPGSFMSGFIEATIFKPKIRLMQRKQTFRWRGQQKGLIQKPFTPCFSLEISCKIRRSVKFVAPGCSFQLLSGNSAGCRFWPWIRRDFSTQKSSRLWHQLYHMTYDVFVRFLLLVAVRWSYTNRHSSLEAHGQWPRCCYPQEQLFHPMDFCFSSSWVMMV